MLRVEVSDIEVEMLESPTKVWKRWGSARFALGVQLAAVMNISQRLHGDNASLNI